MEASVSIKATGPAMAQVILQRVRGELKAMGVAAAVDLDGDTVRVAAPPDAVKAVWRALKATPPVAVAEVRLEGPGRRAKA